MAKKKSWFKMSAVTALAVVGAEGSQGRTARIDILGPIGGWEVSGSDFLRELKSLGEIETIDLRIHSPGGEVLDGWAIANGLKNHPAKVIARVEGMAASMASVVLCAADEVHIPKNAYVMIHNVSGGAWGGSDEMRSTADLIDKLQDDIIDFYATRTGLDSEALAEMMETETWMNGTEAVANGFADKVMKAVDAAALVKDVDVKDRFTNLPAALAEGEGEPEVVPVVTPETPEATSFLKTLLGALGLGSDGKPVKGKKGSSAPQPAGALPNVKTLTAQVVTLKAEVQSANKERDAAIAKAKELEASAKGVVAELAEAGFDFAGAMELPPPNDKTPEKEGEARDAYAEFTAMPQGAAKSEFYQKNEAAILAAKKRTA